MTLHFNCHNERFVIVNFFPSPVFRLNARYLRILLFYVTTIVLGLSIPQKVWVSLIQGRETGLFIVFFRHFLMGWARTSFSAVNRWSTLVPQITIWLHIVRNRLIPGLCRKTWSEWVSDGQIFRARLFTIICPRGWIWKCNLEHLGARGDSFIALAYLIDGNSLLSPPAGRCLPAGGGRVKMWHDQLFLFLTLALNIRWNWICKS